MITEGPCGRFSLSDGDFSTVSLGLPSDFHRVSEEGRSRDCGAAWRGGVGRTQFNPQRDLEAGLTLWSEKPHMVHTDPVCKTLPPSPPPEKLSIYMLLS